MEWLNYHHLLYFWMVAKHGSIVRASHELRLAHPTISGQIHRLEEVLGEKLLERKGRNLVLTDAGHLAFRYADEIFSLGREFLDSIKGRAGGRPLPLVVGLCDVLPQAIVHRMLEPAFRLDEKVRVVCRADRAIDAFLGDLALQTVDVILSDAPAPPGTPVRAFSHLLGECGTAFFAAPGLLAAGRRRFPGLLHGAPFLLPGGNAVLRRSLEQWFDAEGLRPRIVGEVDDAALAMVLGEARAGFFAAASVVADDVRRRYGVRLVGRVDKLRQRFYAISVERKIKHPAVAAICQAARKDVFSGA